MSEIIKKVFKRSNINAFSEYDFYKIERKNDNFLECKVERLDDEINFQFCLNNEVPYTEVRNLNLEGKYKALINIKRLYKDFLNLKISLSPINLYYDINMLPKIMIRDVLIEKEEREGEFVKQYKSLIGFVLQNKFSYEDYYQGGTKLLSKNKYTLVYENANSIDEIDKILNDEYIKIREELNKNIIEVDKNKYKKTKNINRITILLLVIVLVVAGYFGGFRLNEEITFNKANAKYILQDYISVMDILHEVRLNRMSKSIKYILSESIIKSESLTEEQKNNIMASVTLNSDERILDFWIHLGRSEMDIAIDIAKQLGNKEYLAYAYMKEKVIIENDKKLSGEEREAKLKNIEENLKNIEIPSDKEE